MSNIDRADCPPNADGDAARLRGSADRECSEAGDAGLVSTLTPEDFRRLGVRPDEARLTVIRQAAVRTSKSLARRQLKMPSEKTELQLSQVATSAYRLMDPRNRVDATARIHVGRILPNALHWAAQASFSSGQADIEREDPVQLDSGDLSERESLIDQQIALLPQTGSELNVPWSKSLDSSDLLHSRPRLSDWLRRQLHRPTVVMALMLLLSSTSLWLWNWRQKSIDSMARAMDYAATLQRPMSVDPSADAANIAGQAAVKSTPLTVLADDDAEAGPVEQANAMIPTNAAATVSEKLPSVQQEFAEEMASDEELIEEFPVDWWNPLAEEIQLVEVDDAMLPLKTDWPFEPAFEWDEPNVSADPPSGLTAATEMIVIAPLPVETKPAIPAEESVASVRRQLTKRIAELGQPVSAENAGQLQSRLEEVLATVEDDSVDAWTIRVMMAEIDWLSGDQLRVERRLQPLEKKFGANLDTLLAATFAGIPEFVDSAPLHASVLQSGLRLADRMLVHESLEHCRGIMKSMTKSANFFGDAEQFRHMEAFDEAVTSMERLRATALQTVAAGVDHATPSTAGITGRYCCFMLRRWDQGMPWLAQGSDRRLAQLCRDELALPEEAAVDARLGIAERWLVTADRHRGREADSMRLHAVELLRAGHDARRGVKQLMAERLVDEIIESIPPFLQVVADQTAADPTRVDRSVEAPVSPPVTEVSANPSTILSEQPSRLNGRIRPGGTDFGIALEYEPSTRIGSSLLEQLNSKLDDEFSQWSIELSGRFEVEADSRIRLRIGEATPGLIQQVWLGEQPVVFDADTSAVVVPIQRGQHSLRWVVTGSNFSSIFIAVQDASTGKEIDIQPAYQPKPDDQPNAMTIKIQRRSP